MTDRIKKQLEFLKNGEYKKQRSPLKKKVIELPPGTTDMQARAVLFEYMLENETPLLYENDIFGFNRTVSNTPTGMVGNQKYGGHGGNFTPDYEYFLKTGMDTVLERINEKISLCSDKNKLDFYVSAQRSLDAALKFSDKYREYAKKCGNTVLYNALANVPRKRAKSFHEACVFLKFIQFTLRCNQNAHITIGGFDKYMLPYFESDLARGVNEDELFEILEDFFITLNIDSDVYFGFQQGDNGMSLVLGGRDKDGNDRYSRLSELCLKASMELCLIDPKINLRIDKNTPIERLEYATQLTKMGLGFPQYSNDDVVIPGLIKLGYSEEDAYDYTVAACWEFIIPGKGYDIPNMDKVNFPLAVERAVKEHLTACDTFDKFLTKVKESVAEECHSAAKRMVNNRGKASPYLSVFVDGCIESGLDVSEGGAIYNLFGAHGVGISTAADSIAAIKKAVYDEGKYSSFELIEALSADFDGYSEIRNYLISCPKMGNNDDYVDKFATVIMDIFSDVFSQYKNRYGQPLRAGTGSAMEYLWSASEVMATPDGRYARTPYGSSFSPSPIAKLNGPLSCIQSFTGYDLTKVINGGPLTMEIHENTFRNDEGIKKVALLVKAFIGLNGHQLQLNSVNREVLIDAQKHPERHKNLIVRVWGWSGYFCELDKDYQDHIIARTEFTA